MVNRVISETVYAVDTTVTENKTLAGVDAEISALKANISLYQSLITYLNALRAEMVAAGIIDQPSP